MDSSYAILPIMSGNSKKIIRMYSNGPLPLLIAIALAKNNNGSLRVCVNNWKLDVITKHDSFLLPRGDVIKPTLGDLRSN